MKDEMKYQPGRPDPLLGAALRWAEGEVPLDDVDWSGMRTNIRNRAAMPLARRRTVRPRPARWVRPLIPIAAAASIAVFLWSGGLDGPGAPIPPVPQAAQSGAAYQTSIQEALLADMTEQEFRRVVADQNDPNELLLIAVSQR